MTTVQAKPVDPKRQTSELNREIAAKWTGTQGWRHILPNAFIITQREVRDSFRDWRIVIPIFVLTLIFPALANFASNLFVGLIEDRGQTEVEGIIDTFLPLMPMLMGFFPISISLVIALETFVGEKERLSLEPLLSTPLTNIELYIGKVVAAIIPPLAAGYLGITLYTGGQVLGTNQWRPELSLVILIYLLTTVQAIVMVTGAVVISSQTTSTRASNLLASVIIVPMSMLVIVESIIMINPEVRKVLWWIMIGLLVVVMLLLRAGTRIFNREELLGRAIDHLNFAWAWRVFADQWRGDVQGFSPIGWYRRSVFPAIKSVLPQLGIWILCAIGFFVAGWILSSTYELPLQGKDSSDEIVLSNLREVFELGRNDPHFIALALGQNVRVLILATLLAVFTFGVMGLFFTAIPFGILGWVMGNMARSGLSTMPFIMATIPHGVVEIPAIALAGAAALRLGAIWVRPPNNMTIGENWLRAFADALKIGLAVVLPLLIIAAILEVHLTPQVVEWVLAR